MLKSVQPQAVYEKFVTELVMPAGTFLWLEYRGANQYRIAPRALAAPKTVRCKQAWLSEDGLLNIETVEIPMRYEGDEHLFRSEQRFEDMAALFREAEERDFSIFDAIYDVLPKLAALHPDGRAHISDIFNAVFFEYRMCSYHTVAHELYDHPCFVEAGDGFYRFEPERGFKRRKPTRQQREKEFWQPQPVQDAPRVAPALIEAELWRQIAMQIPRKLKTLDQGKPFEITSVTHDAIELIVSTGEPRAVPRPDMEQAWNILAAQGELTREQVTPFANFNVAYVLAILAQLPGVEYRIKPLKLVMALKVDQEPVDEIKSEIETPVRVEKMRGGQLIAPDMLPPEPLFMTAKGIPTSGDVGVQLEPDGVQNRPMLEAEPAPDYASYPFGYPNTEAEMVDLLNSLRGRELVLLNYAYSMFIQKAAGQYLEFRFGSGKRAILSLAKIFAAWELLKSGKKLDRDELTAYTSNMQSYLFAILKMFPHVNVLRVMTSNYYNYFLSYQPPAQTMPDERQTGSGESAPKPGLGADLAREQDTIPAAEKVHPFSLKRTSRSPQGDDMHNKTLFSNHFLETRLAGMPEWGEDALPTLAMVRALWQKASQYSETWSEAQTEDEFIKPVLEALGWSFIVQAKAGRGGKVTRPDYALFASESAKNEAYPHQGDDDAFYSRTLAIAEAKYWGRPLSQKDSSGRATWKAESNPSHQMVSYLTGTRAEWGILTNGRVWRLYSREVSSTASEFYEVDLGEVFDTLPAGTDPGPEQVEAFKRWWLFFRQAAFIPQTQARSFVRRVHEGSALYAREISDKLKELVFKEVMPEIAGGFVAYRRQQLGIATETPEGLQEIYRASLSLLYKMLFLLYAEARSLLPMDNPDYRQNSLTAIAEWAAGQIDQKRSLSAATYATPHYEKLLALFKRIDRGDKDLGIPEYNGGLFSPKSAANIFLETHKLSDLAVARAVDILVRDAGQPVDYAFISVRNLGAIYEGLLENKLEVLDAAAGKVALINDKGERKATGSYYTPDYIVEYIVRNTLDPILERRGADYAAAMEQVTRLRGQLLKVGDAATANRLRAELDEAERAAREAFLGIKVLDPAMGSGHFLVNAVDHLTDGIIERMQAWHDAHPESPWDWDPIQQLIEKVRAEIRAELENNGLPLDSRLNDDTALLMRLVMKRCIYGVDLNEMAVELARVSLWLHTFTVGAPLSFLDHHLRWGNSLVGTDVRSVEYNITTKVQETKISATAKGRAKARGEIVRDTEIGFQTNLFGSPFQGLLDLTAVMIEVAERADATLSDVRESAKLYEGLQSQLTPYKQALDLWVSQYFDNPRALEFFASYKDNLLDVMRNPQKAKEIYAETLSTSQILRTSKRFFHWDLEFPEVFIDLRQRNWAENGGFDAVIGNPPYLFITAVEEIDRQFYFSAYPTCDYRFDLYGLFIDKGFDISRLNGSVGFIVPHSLLNNNSFEKIRQKIINESQKIQIVDFTDRVFEGASNEPMLILAKRKSAPSDSEVFLEGALIHPSKLHEVTFKSYNAKLVDKLPSRPFLVRGDSWLNQFLLNPNAKSLGNFTHITQGLRTGDNQKFLTTSSNSEKYRKILSGSEIDRYLADWQGTYVLYDRNSLDAPRDSIFWDSPSRIIAQEIRNVQLKKRIVACLDTDGFIGLNTTNVIVMRPEQKISLWYVMSIISSYLINEFFRNCFVDNHIATQYLSSIPIVEINFTTPAETRAAEVDRCRALVEAGRMEEALALAKSHLPERADVVHDLLAWLAEQMIAMNKSRQDEMKGFLAHLSREVRADLDDLTGKTTLQNYLGDYQKGEPEAPLAAILDVLRKNQKKLGADVSSRAFQEALAREYESSLAKLRPIKSRLAAVDGLIDQVVYALYGLGEEEIKVIEGKG